LVPEIIPADTAAEPGAEGESVETDEEEIIAAEGAPHAVPGQGNGQGNGNGNGDGDGERRRRRRGRRGGRRNRREEAEGAIAPPEYGVAPIDEDVMSAVADFGGPPVEQVPHEVGDYAPAGAQAEARTESRAPALEEAPPPVATPVHADAPPAVVPPVRPAAAPAPASEPPPAKQRRRSTVREPAPFVLGGATPPLPVPATPAPGSAEAAAHARVPAPAEAGADTAPSAPRRAGWWAKRIFGEKE
jgi:ribonuclease E